VIIFHPKENGMKSRDLWMRHWKKRGELDLQLYKTNTHKKIVKSLFFSLACCCKRDLEEEKNG